MFKTVFQLGWIASRKTLIIVPLLEFQRRGLLNYFPITISRISESGKTG